MLICSDLVDCELEEVLLQFVFQCVSSLCVYRSVTVQRMPGRRSHNCQYTAYRQSHLSSTESGIVDKCPARII